MDLSESELVCIAMKIRERVRYVEWRGFQDLRSRISFMLEGLDRLRGIERKLGICEDRQWIAAAKKLTSRIGTALNEAQYQIRELQRSLANPHTIVPKLRDIYEGLIQADDEFGGLSFDHGANAMSVTTEPIELRGFELGEFRIDLHLEHMHDLTSGRAYSIEALDPHPASSN